MTSAASIRLAVVGTGLVGVIHAERVESSSETELAVLCGLNDGVQDLADRLGVPLVTDYHDVLLHEADGVIIATPNRLHPTMGTFFVEQDVPILVEKPIADTVAGGIALCAAGSRSGVPILVGHHRRHHPAVREARRIIAAELGTLIGFTAMVAMRKPDSYYDEPWRRESGAGPLLVNLIHEVDLVRFLCGEIVGVQAITRQLIRPWDFDDTASLLIHLASGAIGTMFISESTSSPWSWESSVSSGMGFHNAGQDYAFFMGTEASLSFPSLTIWEYDDGDGEPGWFSPLHKRRVDAAGADPYAEQIAHFAQVIRSGVQPIVSGEDGLRSLAVVEAVVEAGRTGSLVDIDSLMRRAQKI